MRNKLFLVVFFFLILGHNLYCQSAPAPANVDTATPQAQTEERKGGESYYNDPFSEIETTEDEEYEESIDRFYTFGRILHLSIYGGLVIPRGPMTDIYASGAMGGFRISYFIDWDVAISFGFGLGKLSVSIPNMNAATANVVDPITGGATMANLALGLKYYINFNDISKPIAYINPAISAGVELTIINDYIDQDILDIFATKGYTLDPSHRSIAPGLFMGISVEFPIFRKSIYLGGEFMYHMSFFSSSNPDVTETDPHFGWIDYSGNYMSFGGSLIWNI
jgi:hypothetical protein